MSQILGKNGAGTRKSLILSAEKQKRKRNVRQTSVGTADPTTMTAVVAVVVSLRDTQDKRITAVTEGRLTLAEDATGVIDTTKATDADH